MTDPRQAAIALMWKADRAYWENEQRQRGLPTPIADQMGVLLDALLSDEGRPLLIKLLAEGVFDFSLMEEWMVQYLRERGVLVHMGWGHPRPSGMADHVMTMEQGQDYAVPYFSVRLPSEEDAK